MEIYSVLLKGSYMKYNKKGLLNKISNYIINFRLLIIIAFIALTIFAALMINKTNIKSDLTIFLPDYTETKQGLKIMTDEFETYGNAYFIISNIEYEKADELAQKIKNYPLVIDIKFNDTELHYVNSCANISVMFAGSETDAEVIKSYKSIKEMLEKTGYDLTVYTGIDNQYVTKLAQEMIPIIIVITIILVIVLLLTTNSVVEMIICMVVFAVAAVINMGTNFILPYVSGITSAVAVVLQLAIAVDYAIILCKKVEDETKISENYKEGVIVALSKTIVEIVSSSLTTIAGLVCLCLMQFRLGYDMGIVLAKGVLCSLVTVFLLMPGLLYIFRNPIRKTKHKTIVPKIKKFSKFVVNSKCIFAVIFAIIIPFSIILSNKVNYAFADVDINELTQSESREAMHKLYNNFGYESTVALLVPGGDYESEKKIVERIYEIEDVTKVMSIASFEVKNGIALADDVDSKQFAELLGIDYEVSSILFMAHGAENKNYSSIFIDTNAYKVPLYKMLMYSFEKIDEGFVKLTPELEETVNTYRPLLGNAVSQLVGSVHDRIAVTIHAPLDDPASVEKVNKIRNIANEYYDGGVYTFGEITSTKDSRDTYFVDKDLIAILTIVLIFIIVFLSFKSLVGSAILIFVIQTAIWANFGLTYLYGNTPLFLAGMVVTAIQMGATIDYAIVLYNRYQSAKSAGMEKKPAMMRAMGDSFSTIFTSGFIFIICGFLTAFGVEDVYISHIGLLIGQGALISFILIFTALPQLILIFDKWIEKTTIRIRKKSDDDIQQNEDSQIEQIEAKEEQ